MAREKKPEIADKVTLSTTSDVVTIYHDRNDHSFYADYNGERYRDAKFSEVRSKVVEAMKTGTALEWLPVIQIDLPDSWRSDGTSAHLSIDIRRFYICSPAWGKVYRCCWETEEKLRRHDMSRLQSLSDTRLPVHRAGVHFLSYSEELWEKLTELVATTNEATVALEEVLSLNSDSVIRVDAYIQLLTGSMKKLKG